MAAGYVKEEGNVRGEGQPSSLRSLDFHEGQGIHVVFIYVRMNKVTQGKFNEELYNCAVYPINLFFSVYGRRTNIDALEH